ncbi:hypothetical protein LAD12857_34490 [Lacrimispora amygdalina]|uniref:Putative Flp pilus-assembly TadG-like N-terminal domain-containing protein n=1 Tax=Lacrimispora amygdalina TaxID=253257 RepID=A0ABQ5M991_9FIRM
MKNRFGNRKGSILVIVTLMLTAMLGAVALVTDVGMAYLKKQQLNNAVDSAALAGAQVLRRSQAEALDKAFQYAQLNGFDTQDVAISFPNSHTISVEGKKRVDFIFARVLGHGGADVNARAKAIIAPISGVRGVKPFVVERFDFEYGVEYVLKEGADESYIGNFGAVALGSTGADTFRDNLKYSYAGIIRVNDWIKTETGNVVGPSKDGVDYIMAQCNHTPQCSIESYVPNCERVITIPMVNTLQVNGSSEVQVVGFAQFLLSGISNEGGHSNVRGCFLRTVISGEIDPNAPDFGVYSIKLVQ